MDWKYRNNLLSGFGVAVLAGVAEYAMTDGTSGLVPLIAGIIGVIFGPILVIPITRFLDWRKNSTPKSHHNQERKREAWEIPGARTQKLKLYELACWLVSDDPQWPLPTKRSEEEYNALLAAIEAGKLDSPLVHENDTTLSYDARFLNRDDVDNPGKLDDNGDPIAVPGILIERRVIRRYLRSIGRTIPEFMEERFDE